MTPLGKFIKKKWNILNAYKNKIKTTALTVSLAGISVIFGLEGVFSYPSLDILAIIGRKFEDQWLQFRVWTPILIFKNPPVGEISIPSSRTDN